MTHRKLCILVLFQSSGRTQLDKIMDKITIVLLCLVGLFMIEGKIDTNESHSWGDSSTIVDQKQSMVKSTITESANSSGDHHLVKKLMIVVVYLMLDQS